MVFIDLDALKMYIFQFKALQNNIIEDNNVN